jgi:hypothetical protein
MYIHPFSTSHQPPLSKEKLAINESWKVIPALHLIFFVHMYSCHLPAYVQPSNVSATYDCVKVELIGPTLMFEYVTEAPGDLDSTSTGTPELTSHVPRAAPGLLEVVG